MSAHKKERNTNDFLENIRVTYKPIFTHSEHKKDWTRQKVDCFKIVFTNRLNGNTAAFDFYRGIGHRTPDGHAKLPRAANVLHCLLMDMQASEESFNDWCSNFDCDPDSKKAEKIYQACIENGEKLRTIFSSDQIAVLNELLEDY